MEIRAAEERDRLPMALLVAAVAEERDGIGSEPPVDLEARAARFDVDATFVAVDADEIVGLIHLHDIEGSPAAELGMMVASAHRRRGIGRALLDAAVGWAYGRGLERLELDVFRRNANAIALYRRYGFVENTRTLELLRQSGETWQTIGMTLTL